MTEIISKQNAEHYVWGGDCDGWHLLKMPGVSVIQERVPPGRTEVRHFHQRSHQFFFVLSGEATIEVGTDTIRVKPMESCFVEPNIRHVLRNEGTQDLEFILVSVPPSHGDRIATEDQANKASHGTLTNSRP